MKSDTTLDIQLGDAVLYLTVSPHRGTRNLSKKDRPVLDITILQQQDAASMNYLQLFPEEAQEEMEQNRQNYDNLRE